MTESQSFWVTINQAFITAGLTRQGRLYFPLSEKILGAIPVDEFVAEMQKRGYTVWENERKKFLMVDMNLPEMGDEVFEVWRKRDCGMQENKR